MLHITTKFARPFLSAVLTGLAERRNGPQLAELHQRCALDRAELVRALA